jgi:hypothetical protein
MPAAASDRNGQYPQELKTPRKPFRWAQIFNARRGHMFAPGVRIC